MKKGVHAFTIIVVIVLIAVIMLAFGAMTLDLQEIPIIGEFLHGIKTMIMGQ